MKLVSYSHQGKHSFGLVKGDGIVDLAKRTGKPSLRYVLEDLDALKKYESETADVALKDVTLDPTIPDPDKILCLGLNYAGHLKETGREKPAYPTFFSRFNNTQVGQDAPLIRPKVSERFDFEGEMALVIGKRCRHVKPEDAYSVIAGYSIYNDASVRDWQRHTIQWLPGKNFVGTGAFGPWLVTTDEVPDILNATLRTRLNGTEMQHTEINDLMFDIPAQIVYASTFTELVPGDVIVTGTPDGVGAFREPPIWMKAGDVVEVEIDGLGTLRNPIVDEK